DSIDWTDGWAGSLQYAIVKQNSGDDNGIEGDNNGDTTADATPRSTPTIANITLIGDGASGEGVQLRAGTAGAVINAIVTNFAEGLEWAPAGIGPDPDVDSIALDNLGVGVNFSSSGNTLFTAGANNTEYTNTLTGSAGVTPGANELSLTAQDPSTYDSALDAATYVGAVEDASDTWYLGWTLGL
ncbi:MAG: hypothetical protein KDA46_07410, partial [Parvularculaceae bacterium]|nr:hypothetical protein [Parvularculaceae bacterium]